MLGTRLAIEAHTDAGLGMLPSLGDPEAIDERCLGRTGPPVRTLPSALAAQFSDSETAMTSLTQHQSRI